ncbi:glycosyltransferase [Streptomyces sp. NBRC 109706]|uniref:glycosyltransferase n=1 Tax=Streptomyces sp. NBRC 109706 TaxID=1550035 RepID=UPI000784D48F|nr:glycosyltransferase [Streptomyces sp. NBRC 109706]
MAVVICAYTQARWAALGEAVEAVRAQLDDGDELVLVIDHEEGLLARARQRWPAERVVPSEGNPGLSGARNTGVRHSTAELVAFLDDDAVPRPGWLAALRRRLAPAAGESAEGPVGMVGGAVVADWQCAPPRWFPEELGWVVGCDYRGLPGDGDPIRNPIGASMAATRHALESAGPFSEGLGRTAQLPAGCEETELAIRLRDALPDIRVVRDTTAVVDHKVPAERATVRYLVRRCWHEGLSKAALTRAVGAAGALRSERAHALRMVTGGTARHLLAVLRGDPWGPLRAGVGLLGLGTTAAGYATGTARLRRAPQEPPPPDDFTPLRPADLDLDPDPDAPLAPLPVPEQGRAHLLLRRRGWPLAQLRLDALPPRPDRDQWLAAVHRARPDLTDQPEGPDEPDEPDEPAPAARAADGISVVLATLGRTPLLPRAVAALLDQEGPLGELIVVDNDPEGGGVARLLAEVVDPRLRVVPEPRRGASRARSTGLRHVRSPLVAFTDDDALPDPDWTRHTVDTFACDPTIRCVTGLVVPAELLTPAQVWFEEAGGFEKGYRLAVWAPGGADAPLRSALDRLARSAGSPEPAVTGHRGAAFPYTAGEFGSGNSMAFRTETLRALGGFDPALGPGTPTLGGEDLDVFRAVYLDGGTVVYNPRVLVRHHHRRDYAELSRQMYGYGAGLTAHVTKLALTGPRHLPRLLARAPASARMLLAPGSTKNAGKSPAFPAALGRTELRGIVAGPWTYLRSRRALGRSRRWVERSAVRGEDRRHVPHEGKPAS